jgi:hypothetical protein
MPWLAPEATSYLARMNFFKYVEIEDVNVPDKLRNDLRLRLTELTKIDSHAESDHIANRLADAITGTLTEASSDEALDPNTGMNKHERFRHPIWYSLSELLENSLTHARQNGRKDAAVWVAAQYYRSTGIVKMAVVDNGCGMLATLENHPKLVEKSHHGAIQTALIPKVSCNRDGRLYNTQANQGVGLTTTARIAKAAEGGLIVASGDSVHRTLELGMSGILPHRGSWNGVAIGFQCKRRALPAVRVRDLLPTERAVLDVQFTDP